MLCSSFFIQYILHNKIGREQHPKDGDEESSAHLRFRSSGMPQDGAFLPLSFVLISWLRFLQKTEPEARTCTQVVVPEGDHRKQKREAEKSETKKV